MGNDKITLDSISRADLHKLVIELQERITELEGMVKTQGDAILILAKQSRGE